MNLKKLIKVLDSNRYFDSGDLVHTSEGDGRVVECRDEFVLVEFEDGRIETLLRSDVTLINN